MESDNFTEHYIIKLLSLSYPPSPPLPSPRRKEAGAAVLNVLPQLEIKTRLRQSRRGKGKGKSWLLLSGCEGCNWSNEYHLCSTY